MKYSGLRNYECTVYCTSTHSIHRNTGGRDCPNNPWGKALESTVTRIPANAFTVNINSTNANTLRKANFS